MSELRPPTDDDAAAVARLMSEHWPEPVDEDRFLTTWSAPGFVVELDARFDGRGYAHVGDLGNGRAWIELHGRPSDGLVEWAEERAKEKVGVRAFSGAWTTNEPIRRELEQRGYRIVRYALRMGIELDEQIDEPTWPDRVTVRSLRDGDEQAFYDAHQETFADTWEPPQDTYEEWTHFLVETSSFDPELWFVAQRDGEMAGFAICCIRASDPERGWVQLLGVRRPFRGLGLGRALLLHCFGEFRRRGMRRAALGVDAENLTGAQRLYASVGMTEFARFEVREKVLE